MSQNVGTGQKAKAKGKGVSARSGMIVISSPLMDELVRLCELEIDAVALYQQACERMQDREFKAALLRFGADHERHVANLTNVILGYGGRPPLMEKEFRGFKTKGVASLAGLDNDHAILKTMMTNEVLTNQMYDGILTSNLLREADEALRLMLESHCEDERRHLEFIEDVVLILDRGGKASISEQGKTGEERVGSVRDQDIQH